MKKIFKKLFPLFFKLRDDYNNEVKTMLSFEELRDLATYYVMGKSYPIIVIFTIIIYKSLEYFLK